MHVLVISFKYVALIFSPRNHIPLNTNKKMTLLDGDVDEKINPYINVTGVITDFDQTSHSFNMCPMQYIALPCTTSPLPLHSYFVESKRWGEGKKPTLSIGSTIAFSSFIDRI